MVEFCDLGIQRKLIQKSIEESITRVLDHGKFILGPEVAILENELCEYTGARYCIGVANGTDAILIALMALGIGEGDEVITAGFSYIAVAEAIALLGDEPVYVDIESDT